MQICTSQLVQWGFALRFEVTSPSQYITAEKPFRLLRIISVSFASLLLDTHVSE
jgi:hypothetical protein